MDFRGKKEVNGIKISIPICLLKETQNTRKNRRERSLDEEPPLNQLSDI